ncbi:hypothetical protein BT69DRAFT_1298621 [Atractiella rhizophila]|nr:hypothetical protein BT69DRAFT_1298621 [Atractiella rhizophila]
MANRVTLIELRNLLQDVVDMQTSGYKVSDNLSVMVKSAAFKHILPILKDNAIVMKLVGRDVQRRCTKAHNAIKKEIKDSIEEMQHIQDLTNYLHRFKLGTYTDTHISESEMMLVSMLRQFVKFDLELESQGKKVIDKPMTGPASKKRKRAEHADEWNEDDEEDKFCDLSSHLVESSFRFLHHASTQWRMVSFVAQGFSVHSQVRRPSALRRLRPSKREGSVTSVGTALPPVSQGRVKGGLDVEHAHGKERLEG